MPNEFYEQGAKLAMQEFLISGKVAAKKAKGPKKLVPKMPGEMAAKAARGLAAMGKK